MASSDRIQTVVAGRYRLDHTMGAGGSGTVWAGEDTILQRAVAVKAVELPSHLEDDERVKLRTRVLREARATARIDSTSSVRVFDVIEEGDRIYLVMELVRAPTLADSVEKDGPFLPVPTAAIGLDLLDALAAAHRAGIVHRDVKPRNVMLLDSGAVKLADFGIASVKDDPRITTTGMVLGTPSYMSPEQARGDNVGAMADTWGLGALLYYAVEGVAPFDRGEPFPTLNAVLHDQPRRPIRAGPLTPVILAMLSKAPEDRPTDDEAQRLLTDVVRGDESTVVVPASRPDDPHAVPATEVVARFEHPQAGHETTDLQPESRPYRGPRPWPYETERRSPLVWLAALAGVAALGLLVFALTRGDGGGAEQGSGPDQTAAPGSSSSADPGVSSTAPSSAPETTAPPTDARPEGVPADWAPFEDQEVGYSLWIPPGWERVRRNVNNVDFVDPATNDYVRIGWTNTPGPDPVGAWEGQSRALAGRYPDYVEIRITEEAFQGFPGARWEYTFSGLHASNLGFVTPEDGFAINFVTAESRWEERQDVRRAFEAGFRPPAG